MSTTSTCLIGFGEVGATLADDLAGNATLSAWDMKFRDAASKPTLSAKQRGVRIGASAVDAASGATLIISAVTAANTVTAAQACAPAMINGAIFLDLNSASPASKRQAAAAINGAGGRYVEAAVMSPIAPKRIATSMLLGGPHAEDFLSTAHGLGFTGASFFSAEYGQAAAAKLCRSIIVKGLEAMLTESLLTARRYGVEDTVLASLDDLLPGPDWTDLARYMISRSIEHGARRSEEMLEAARAVCDAGLDPTLSEAIAARQAWAAAFDGALGAETLPALLDAMRSDMPALRSAP